MARLENADLGLSESSIVKLRSAGILTVYDFMLLTCEELVKKTDMPYELVDTLQKTIVTKFGGNIEHSLDVYSQEREDVISTGLSCLDNLLDGGFHCRQIYEICGCSSAGKSQLCHWFAMHATLNDLSQVHYVDASRQFFASRIQMILDMRKASVTDFAKVMSAIKVHQVHRIHDLVSLFHELATTWNESESSSNKKLIIIDSLSLLCAIVPSTELTQILCSFASICRYLANRCRVAVVVINRVRAEQRDSMLTDKSSGKSVPLNFQPSLGKYWQGVPNVRLLIDPLERGRREIRVWKSTLLENGKCCFVDFNDEGILPK
ncbi:DNA repair protein RAD51 homolog 4 [Trichogramma pretiosum]|uniref:DNA repair protein RAD51 homolog 4 n=1 Tax=Trichogramma pretiosum TaxID=7493 RepID=UPI0006C94FBE|nr:DNA repair protein RAD51 homolog 4 [Trichogramma pretiosum]